MGLDTPALAISGLALQVGESLRRPGDFQAAHWLGAWLTVELELRPQVHGVAGEVCHGLGRIDLKDQAGRVRRGAAGLEERALLDDYDVPPSELSQVVRHAASRDSRAYDDGPGVIRHHGVRHVSHVPFPCHIRRKSRSVRCCHAGCRWRSDCGNSGEHVRLTVILTQVCQVVKTKIVAILGAWAG